MDLSKDQVSCSMSVTTEIGFSAAQGVGFTFAFFAGFMPEKELITEPWGVGSILSGSNPHYVTEIISRTEQEGITEVQHRQALVQVIRSDSQVNQPTDK